MRCAGLSLRWLLLLWSMGSRRTGFSSCGSWALECRLSSCGPWALLLRGTWDLPGPGLEPVSPALAGGFLTTVPPGKSQKLLILMKSNISIFSCESYFWCHIIEPKISEIFSNILFHKFYCIYFWLRWVFVAARRFSLVAVCGPLIAVASLVVEHGL